ncbi:MAG: S9 family peptidase [Elusimicrobia bacterium]|nr:S9 family peptidase [Elusimicrobiota bacterium]
MPILTLLLTLAFIPAFAAEEDPYLWLEEVESPKAMEWVKARNETSLGALTGDKRYAGIEADVRRILTAKDRLPMPGLRNGWVYNFWQDADHVRGLWRRTRPDEYAKPEPKWEILLDVDKLNAVEKQDWVWHGSQCLPPAYTDCLIKLSHGGKDAQIVREFDVERGTWIAGGFELPEAKCDVAWMDRDRIFVGTDFGPGSLTKSGYPRLTKLWTRGQPLSSAKTVIEGQVEDVSVSAYSTLRPEGSVLIAQRQLTFFTSKLSVLENDLSLTPLAFPEDANFYGVYKGDALAVLRSAWNTGKRTLPAGALVALPLGSRWSPNPQGAAELIYAPDARSSVNGAATTANHLYVSTLQNVQGKVFEASKAGGAWRLVPVALPGLGSASIQTSDDYMDMLYLSYESFLVPATVFRHESGGTPAPVRRMPARFDAKGLVAKQYEAVSKDGTKVPYFVVHREGIKLDGSHPTLLYGYGGFEISMDPFYLNDYGKVWLEAGGVYAIANIRGGGEFGPKWHEAALKENRQRAYDDFIGVAEDLIKRKVSSPRRLGIMGGSNGGLLVGATFVQRPELFRGVVCQVPLLDMLRYTKIAAGPSWVAEYGDPADPKMAESIRKYSPYQNVKKGTAYPEIFLLTSTKDDRVGPVHARKMAARLEELGHKTWYWENIEGGHGAAADLEERVKMHSLEFTYLFQRLVD